MCDQVLGHTHPGLGKVGMRLVTALEWGGLAIETGPSSLLYILHCILIWMWRTRDVGLPGRHKGPMNPEGKECD